LKQKKAQIATIGYYKREIVFHRNTHTYTIPDAIFFGTEYEPGFDCFGGIRNANFSTET